MTEVKAPKEPMLWDSICPTPFEVFVIEGQSDGKPDWYKLGATFFGEEAAAIVDHFTSQGRKCRYRKYIPAPKAKKGKR